MKNTFKKVADAVLGILIYIYMYIIVPVFQNAVVAKVCSVMAVVGIIFAIGTAGASDMGNISFTQMVVQMVISVVMVWMGVFAYVCRAAIK